MNQQNNGKGYGPALNTSMSIMYSQTGRLRLGLWNERITIDITPLTAGPTGNKTYSNENSAKVTITKPEAILLLNAIERIKSSEHSCDVNIPIGFGDSKKMIGITRTDENTIIFKIYQSKLSNGAIDTERFTSHPFRTNVYDANGETVTVLTDFIEFASRVREFVNCSVVANHAYRYSEMMKQNAAHTQGGGRGSYQNNSSSGGYTAAQSTYSGNDLSFLPSEAMNDLPF